MEDKQAKQLISISKSSRGKTLYEKHQKGQSLTPQQAMVAKCFECMGGWVDGRGDCKIPGCPIYPFQPYRDEKPEPRRKMSPEHAAAAGKRLSEYRTRAKDAV